MHPLEYRSAAETQPHSRERRYGRTIAWVSAGFGVVGMFLGILGVVILCGNDAVGRSMTLYKVVAGVVFCAAVFWGLGLGVACLFAPTSFFENPTGKLWLARIGTQSIVIARSACVAYMLVVAAIIAVVVYLCGQ